MRFFHLSTALVLAALAGSAFGAERRFLVILAKSPKQGQNENTPRPTRNEVDRAYFDRIANNSINSFAEYWEEISYGDVTITGETHGWIDLPWSVVPPPVNGPLGGSPANYLDLDGDGIYQYGASEYFNNSIAAVILDFDGNPGARDNGPFVPASGSRDVSRGGNNRGFPVWRPGERFVDVDGDGRWDGFDEAVNWMDWNGDGFPDQAGPFTDLNQNGQADGAMCNLAIATAANPNAAWVWSCPGMGGCYLPDSDNDGNPDCCPNGPTPGAQNATCRCPGTVTPAPDGDFPDCNGNGVPDALDIAFGISRDSSPVMAQGTMCVLSAGDGIPDECQFVQNYPVNNGCRSGQAGDTDPCRLRPECTPIVGATTPTRCEYFDANRSNSLDIVEPFENFLRRWDPCIRDPDAASLNRNSRRAHWIKVYDPNSPNAAQELTCAEIGYKVRYDDPSYILNNYPGDAQAVIGQASARPVYGSHDPGRFLTSSGRRCSLGPDGRVDPATCTPPTNTSAAACRCEVDVTGVPRGFCADVDMNRNGTIDCTPQNPRQCERSLCLAGFHAEYDPPDSFTNETTPNRSSAKMIWAAQPIGGPYFFFRSNTESEPAWFKDAWEDRYGTECPAVGGGTATCEAPPWPQMPPESGVTKIPMIIPFTDTDPGTYDPALHRRYFNANWGGLNGDGTGWLGEENRFIRFETGPMNNSFERNFDRPILPEETEGPSSVAQFFDGWVEHDDLPSSKYHLAGDQWLGEVTSPYLSTHPPQDVWGFANVPAIWGHDRGPHVPDRPATGPDGRIPVAGPYAVGVHGSFGRDGGNVMTMELLTWRTDGKYLNNGRAWESEVPGRPYGDMPSRFHPYAGPNGENLGFRDYNLDGLIDLGETRPAGSENYIEDADPATFIPGTDSRYPWNRRRLWEDVIAILDDAGVDFDSFVDRNSLEVSECSGSGSRVAIAPFTLGATPALASGFCSGIVILPAGTVPEPPFQFPFLNAGEFVPIHNEDGLNDPSYPNSQLPARRSTKYVSWNIHFNDLVASLDQNQEGGPGVADFLVSYSAHEYLHTWQGFPDLYDYDRYDQPGPELNCPIGGWDIMADGGLVHPTPILKEDPRCTRWIVPTDITTRLTPGVDRTITLPAAEFVRDNSYYYLESELFAGATSTQRERHYFWSAGSGFDSVFPSRGLLILHSDVDANSNAPPPQQRLGSHFTYYIIQADGRDDLTSCANFRDDGDPFPGSSNNTRFDCSTHPSARWYNGNACTGLSLSNIRLDASGSVQFTANWVPTVVPSLRFTSPPAGSSVGNPPNARYNVRAEVTDRFGGTTINFYFTNDESNLSISAANRIGTVVKRIPGSTMESLNWNLGNLPDGRYFVFAELIPGMGSEGRQEAAFSQPRAGRNNAGNGTLSVNRVNIQGRTARLETWLAQCVNAAGTQWRITSSITQPEPPTGQPVPEDYIATTGTEYCSRPRGNNNANSAVCLTIMSGNQPFRMGDTFTFSTTGITAPSRAVTVVQSRISEGPTAIIAASPLAGNPPLRVDFDARNSVDPNGEPLQFTWNFGDGSTATGAQVSKVFTQPRTFTVTLRATNARTGLFDEALVDIAVTNNSPNAVARANPTSGRAPLQVEFSAAESSDLETPRDRLIYQWDFGNGAVANPAGQLGTQFSTVTHTFNRDATGRLCTSAAPCVFNVVLTVTDEGGKQDTDQVTITVGNTQPVVNITVGNTQGPTPLEVVFNALNTTDPDGDRVCIRWIWDDGSPDDCFPRTGRTGATDGSVPHTFRLPANETFKTFRPRAEVFDYPGEPMGACTCQQSPVGSRVLWPGVTVTVTQATPGASNPIANFTITPAEPVLNQPFTVDASASFDRPTGGQISSYTWNFGDGTTATGRIATHTYTRPGTFRITLVVADGETPPNTGSRTQTVIIVGDGTQPPPTNRPPIASFVISPTTAGIGSEIRFDARGSTDPDGDPISYSWSFGDGATATGAQAAHSYSAAGNYTVRLTLRDDEGNVTEAIQTVRITFSAGNSPPVISIATGPRSGVAPLTLTFDARNSYDPDGDSLTYLWAFFRQGVPDGEPIAGALVTRTFVTPGTYSARLTLTDSGGATVQSSEQVIQVFQPGTVIGNDNTGEPGGESPVNRNDNRDSADQRPPTMCGLGILPGFLGSYLALMLAVVSRRMRARR